MKRLTQIGVWLGLLLLAAGFPLPATAKGAARKQPVQGSKGGGKASNNSGNQPKQPANDQKNKTGNATKENNEEKGNAAANGRGGLGLPPKFVERLQEMSPEEQERFMKNNERFRNMPPERQAQIRRTLQRWNNLAPETRTMLRQREAALEQMSPQEQKYVQQELKPEWRDMVPNQRRFMLQHLHELYALSAPEAEAKLGDPAFTQGMGPQQLRMLPYLYRLRIGAAPEPPPGPPES
jgi:hypothetical protein